MWCNALREKPARKRVNNPKLANMRAWNVKKSRLPSLLLKPILDRVSSNFACANRVRMKASARLLTTRGKRCVLSDRLSCAPVYGVPLNNESKTFYFSFFKVLARLTRLTRTFRPWFWILSLCNSVLKHSTIQSINYLWKMSIIIIQKVVHSSTTNNNKFDKWRCHFLDRSSVMQHTNRLSVVHVRLRQPKEKEFYEGPWALWSNQFTLLNRVKL
jgi:hypothetical protein